MNDILQVGEVGIICGTTRHPENIGKECEVIDVPGLRSVRNVYTGEVYSAVRYLVRFADGELWAIKKEHLRRKPPKDDGRQIVRWTDCPWQPERATCDASEGRS